MTPKEKAKELFKKQYQLIWSIDWGLNVDKDAERYEAAKQCALIAVDEILNLNFNINCDATERCVNPVIEFWQQVKKQIEKL